MPASYRMTPKRRFMAGILGGRVDRPAVGSVTSVATVEQMEMTGAYFPDVHTDGEKMARLAAGARDILGYDAIMPYFSVQAAAAALGSEVDWGDIENMPVARSHPWSDPEEVRIPDDFLEKPSIKAVLDAIAILRHKYGHRVAIVGKVMGPWTLAYHMHGVENFLIETITDPDKAHRFLDLLKEVSVLFGLAQVRAGADVICLGDHATGDLVGPWTYRDYLPPYHREITQRIGSPMVLHCCGNTLDRMDYICESGFDCFHFESKVDAREAVEKVNGRISLMGNLNNPETLLNGTADEVAEQARYAVEAGVQVIGPECAIPLRTPLENLKAIAVGVREAQGAPA
jgi:[methyl-Co(III) methanol-specific corrinoid protein]:coenzyme M methyltransferase